MIKTKPFDCVEMKRAGAKALMEKLEPMSAEERRAFWDGENQKLKREMANARATATPETTEEFMAKLEALVEGFEKEQAGS